MTPKQKYNERKRLKAERLHRTEVKLANERQQQDDTEQLIISLASSMERVADVLELWADQQK